MSSNKNCHSNRQASNINGRSLGRFRVNNRRDSGITLAFTHRLNQHRSTRHNRHLKARRYRRVRYRVIIRVLFSMSNSAARGDASGRRSSNKHGARTPRQVANGYGYHSGTRRKLRNKQGVTSNTNNKNRYRRSYRQSNFLGRSPSRLRYTRFKEQVTVYGADQDLDQDLLAPTDKDHQRD